MLPAYRDGVALLVWCDHEQMWHTHGGCTGQCPPRQRRHWGHQCECPAGAGDGPRAAHCTCREQRRDYVLCEVGPFTEEVRRAHGPELRYSSRCRYGDCRLQRGRRSAAGAAVAT